MLGQDQAFEPRTLVELLMSYEGRDGPRLVLVEEEGPDQVLGLGRLLGRAQRFLGRLQARGVARGTELVLQVPELEHFLVGFWAGVLGGMPPVPVTPAANMGYLQKLVGVLQRLHNTLVLTTRSALARLQRVGGDVLAPIFSSFQDRVLFVEETLEEEADGVPWDPTPEDVAFIQFSSGSTGDPKGVVLTHANLVTTVQAMARAIRAGPDDSALSWLPLTHDMGLIGLHLTPVYQRADHCLMAPRVFVRDPLSWLDRLSRYGATVTGSPDFGLRMVLQALRGADGRSWDLSRVRVLFNGAEPISPKVCRAFLGALAPHGLSSRVIVPGYGLSEATLAVTFGPPNASLRTRAFERSTLAPGRIVREASGDERGAVELVDLGRPIEGCCCRVVSWTGKEVGEGEVGRVQVRGRNVARGYYRGPGKEEPITDAEGWLETGDIGFRLEGGLFLTGREKEVICLNGRNHYPADLERLLEPVMGLPPGRYCVAGVFSWERMADRVVLFVESDLPVEALEALLERARARLVQTIGLDVDAVASVGRLPRTTSGKLQRGRVARWFTRGKVTGKVEARGSAPGSEVEGTFREGDGDGTVALLRSLWERVSGGMPLESTASFLDQGVDSVLLARLQAELDRLWPGKIGVADLFVYRSVEKLAAFIDSGFARRGRVGLILHTRVPGASRIASAGEVSGAAFEWELSPVAAQGLARVAERVGGSLEDVVMAVVAGVLAQLGEVDEVPLQTWDTRGPDIACVTIPVPADAPFESFLSHVVDLRRDTNRVLVVDPGRVTPVAFEVPEDMVSVLILRAPGTAPWPEAASCYDVVLGVQEREDRLQFVLEYRSRRVAREVARRLSESLALALDRVAGSAGEQAQQQREQGAVPE